MVIAGSDQVVGYVHYGESQLLREIRWVPLIEVAAFFLFIALGFLGFRSAKISEQRFIWVGMAKETAHQLGTPISSLMGWIEVMKDRARPSPDGGEGVVLPRALFDETVAEMEADLERLNKVAFRFSNVGSEPKRKLGDVVAVVGNTVEYVRRRLPRLGRGPVIEERYEEVPALNINAELIEWVIENLLVNAVNAVDKPDGRIQVVVERRRESETVEVQVTDNGRGIPARFHHQAARLGTRPHSGQAHHRGVPRRPDLGEGEPSGAGDDDGDLVPDLAAHDLAPAEEGRGVSLANEFSKE
jgi:signal transduction histidine kinase